MAGSQQEHFSSAGSSLAPPLSNLPGPASVFLGCWSLHYWPIPECLSAWISLFLSAGLHWHWLLWRDTIDFSPGIIHSQMWGWRQEREADSEKTGRWRVILERALALSRPHVLLLEGLQHTWHRKTDRQTEVTFKRRIHKANQPKIAPYFTFF